MLMRRGRASVSNVRLRLRETMRVGVPHGTEKGREGDVAVRHGVPAEEGVLEVSGKAHERPQDAD